MEALQILKFIYKKDRLNFMAGFKGIADEQVEPVTGNCEDLLAGLFTRDTADTTEVLLHVFAADDSGDD